MKLTKITSIAIIAIIAIMLTGCQDEQLSQCRLENEELQKTINAQQEKLNNMARAVMSSAQMLIDFMVENEKLVNEVKALKKGARQGQPEPQTQKPAQRPE